jgi:hypothetical protein
MYERANSALKKEQGKIRKEIDDMYQCLINEKNENAKILYRRAIDRLNDEFLEIEKVLTIINDGCRQNRTS